MTSREIQELHEEPLPQAMVHLFQNAEALDETCEACFACLAIGTFDLCGVETLLCRSCSVYRDGRNSEVIIPNEPV